MLRITTAMAAALSATTFAGTALADCTTSGTAITCTGTTTAQIDSDVDGLSISIETGATLATGADRAIDLSGDDQSVDNDGIVTSDDDALRASGPDLDVTNSGRIESTGESAIVLEGDADGATIVNAAGGEIIGADEAIGADNGDAIENVTIINDGLIDGGESRAVQSRGAGTTIVNTGTMTGNEEVIEGRTGFSLTNSGDIVIGDGVVDEDGVQFASGSVENSGLIQGSDDGIDLDEGTIVNSGTIRSAPPAGASGGNAIDGDDVLQAPEGDLPTGAITVTNSGLIEGPTALGVDSNRTAAFNVINTGTLRGTTGPAVAFNMAMDASNMDLSGDSIVDGDVILTGSDDTLTVGGLTSGTLIQNGIFDGGDGADTVVLDGYDLSDVTAFSLMADIDSLTLMTDGGSVMAGLRNFESWTVGGQSFTTAGLAAAVTTTPVPLPAGLPLLGAGLAGLCALRRRRA